MPATTLRFHESEGLLPADRAPNGYRVYDKRAQQRLAFIIAAKSSKLTLPQIKTMLRAWENDSCAAVKTGLRPTLREHITREEESIAQLTELHAAMTGAFDRLDDTPDASARRSTRNAAG